MIKNPYTGKFIAFEGIDGCGKSTQAQKAYELLSSISVNGSVLMVKEPAKYLPSGKLIYGLLFGGDSLKFSSMTPRQRQRYYYMNRIQHYFQTVIPALQSGKNVLTDRSLASIALDVERANDLHLLLEDEESHFRMSEVPFIHPDKVLIYDLPPDIGVARLAKKDDRIRDFFEQPEKMIRHRTAYLEFASRFSDFCEVINGEGDINEVFNRTIVSIEHFFHS